MICRYKRLGFRIRSGSPVLMLGMTVLGLLLVPCGNGWGTIVKSTGKAETDKKDVKGLQVRSTGTNLVFTEAISGEKTIRSENLKKDGFADPAPIFKAIQYKTKDGKNEFFPGLGATQDKFMLVGDPPINPIGVSHSYESTSAAPSDVAANRITAIARAKFQGTIAIDGQKQNFGSKLDGYAEVKTTGKPKGSGAAVAEASDPEEYEFDTPGSFLFEFSLGSLDITLNPDTGDPLPSLGLFSDSLAGFNHFDANVSLHGVRVNDQDLNGELFRLVIEGSGILDSPSDLDVTFLPSPVMGLSDSQIDSVELYVLSNMSILSDGSIGLAAGTRLPLIGTGGPIAALTIDYDAGTVIYEDSTVSLALIGVPEPSTLMLLITGCAALLGYPRRRSR